MNDDYFRKKINPKYTLHDLLKGQDLEIIAASLLLLGKLKVESVQLYRNSPTLSVTLIGEYKSINKDKTNKMEDFLNQNGDITLDEVLDALTKRMNNKRK